MPHAVQNFVAKTPKNTSIDLIWDAPRVSTGPILRYRIRWQNFSGYKEEDTKSDITHYTLQGLAPYVYYKLKCLALTEAGPGAWSEELTIQTDIGGKYCYTVFILKRKLF